MYYIWPRRGQALVCCAGRALGRAQCQGKRLERKKNNGKPFAIVSVDVATLNSQCRDIVATLNRLST